MATAGTTSWWPSLASAEAFARRAAPAAWRRPKRTRWTTSSRTSCAAATLNIHLHCLVLDGVYRRGSNGEPVFVEVPAPCDEALHAVLHKIIARTMKLLTRRAWLMLRIHRGSGKTIVLFT